MTRISGEDEADNGGATTGGALNDGGERDEWGELEIEVSDLRTGATVERRHAPAALARALGIAPRDPAPDGDDNEDFGRGTGEDEDDTLDVSTIAPAPSAWRPVLRAAWRRAAERGGAWSNPRVVRSALVAGAVVLVLVGLLASNAGVRGAVQTRLFPPTPTLAPGANEVWIRHVVPWGVLTIDGLPVAAPSDANTPLLLGRGQHTLRYDAAPFRPLRCTVSVPESPSDTCPRITPSADQANQLNSLPPGELPGERTLDLGATPQKLPAATYKALVAGIQAQLDPFTTTAQLAAGDHYGTPDGQVRVAQRPMSVTMAFVVAPVNPSGAPTNFNGEECNPLCAIVDGPAALVQDWPVSAEVNPQWSYTDDSGATQVVSAPAPSSMRFSGGFSGNLMSFSARWTVSGWRVILPAINTFSSQDQFQSTQCQVATESLPPMDNTSGSNGYSIQPGANTITPQPPAQGCAIAITPMGGNGSPNGPAALVLVRAGALVAANAEAHTLYSTLPVASADEAALAQQLDGGVGQ